MSSQQNPDQEAAAIAESAAVKKVARMKHILEAIAADCVTGHPVLVQNTEFVTRYEVKFEFEDGSQRVITVTIAYKQGHPYAKKVTG